MEKILIIDDEISISTILKRYLEREMEFEVTTNSNPESALQDVMKGSYDLILLDIMMPIIDGIEFLKIIKEQQPSVKVILMTAYNSEKKSLLAKKYNADSYLEKPFTNLEEVKNTIYNVLQK